MKRIYWGCLPETDTNAYISELKYAEPVNVLKDIKPVEFFGNTASRCPAIVDECKNTFKINSPIDLHVTFNKDFTNHESKYDYGQGFVENFIGPFNEGIIQLSSPTYLFFCEEELTMTQLPTYYEDNNFVKNCMGLSATFNISKWFRVVKPCFKFKKNSHTIDINTNTALMYLKFNTNEKVKLIRFDASAIPDNIMLNLMTFKFQKKNPLVPTKLSEGYNAFVKAKYNKRITNIIKENLLE
tara:strand:- start:21 stop:743 length:723 start_codon:yes stop_codon:yes gene_type:complete